MSKKDMPDSIPGNLAELLATLGIFAGAAKVIRIDVREGEALEDAIARIEAEHREECPGCAAEHAAALAEAQKDADALVSKAKADAEAEKQEKQKEADKPVPGAQTEGIGADPAPRAVPTVSDRTVVGYMAIMAMNGKAVRHIPQSFHPERAAVADKLEEFKRIAPIEELNAAAAKLGAPIIDLRVVPVYFDHAD